MAELLESWFPNVASRLPEFFDSFMQTLVMVSVSGVISFLLSIVIGVGLTVTRRGGIKRNGLLFNVLDKLIDLFRSIPFIILAAALVPVTRMMMGTAIGPRGAIFPLVVGITPFFSRQIESALASVDAGLVEAAESMGMTTWQVIRHVYLREGVPSIIRVTTITLISLIGETATVGIVGGGGLGDFAIRLGYQRYMYDVTWATIIVLVVLIAVIELFGRLLAEVIEH
ncbi:ABC transporter permease [Bifidobacterium actinocoloniiforme DSM 22766]|uniref:ABC transporter permease n=1 Tax=Bifidobacterium actinocoloniiforme DSM 22766 TaxID=1437605 RepID=A0A086Z1E5_9BIFI|nr:methionine ABC transporter permease [Bifidobacterium actinocoloniiforme]AKV55494.1 ABC transporter permease [Bifidobacterium actinocoloniiforme DSM 22766]KFI40345.1 ABC transporter permease [Bifidobacterium actinocoloniiforme DSM 22766]